MRNHVVASTRAVIHLDGSEQFECEDFRGRKFTVRRVNATVNGAGQLTMSSVILSGFMIKKDGTEGSYQTSASMDFMDLPNFIAQEMLTLCNVARREHAVPEGDLL